MQAFVPSPQAFAVQHFVHLASIRPPAQPMRHSPVLGKFLGILAAALEARPMPGGERGRLVEKEQLDFKGRQRDVWGRFYTELFFLDEPTALAAGHRPCFECRRKDAQIFAEHWRVAHRQRRRPNAGEMDEELHRERLRGRDKRLHRRNIDGLSDGVFVVLGGEAYAVRGDRILHWTPQGYDAEKPRPRGGTVDVLTPPAIIAVLSAGYEPRWHPSATV